MKAAFKDVKTTVKDENLLSMRKTPLEWMALCLQTLFCAGLLLVPVAYLLLSLGILVAVGQYSYASILHWYAGWRPDAYNVQSMAARCFTPRWYDWLRGYRWWLMGGITGVLGLYFFYLRRVWFFLRVLAGEIGGMLRLLVRVYAECTGRQRVWLWLLFGGILAYRVYFCWVYPLIPDEAFSYLFFVRQGWLVTATSYPLPNNHILFNIIGCWLYKFSWLSPKAVMRGPSIVENLVLLYAVFCLFRRWGGFQRAILVVAGVAWGYFLSYYAVQGRGYQLQEICALVSGLACWECFCGEGRARRRGYASFIVASVAGVYINPTFLYHFTALLFMVGYYCRIRRDRATAMMFLRAVAAVGVLVLILFLPLVLGSSFGALKDNTQYETPGYGRLFYGVADIAYSIKMMTYYGRPGVLLACLLAAGFLYLYKKRIIGGVVYSGGLVYLVSVGVSLLLWSIYARRYPMDRTLCWLALAVMLFFMNACYDLWKARWARLGSWVFVVFLLLRGAGSLRGLFWAPDSVGERSDVQTYRVIEGDLGRLDRYHPGSWQITKSDDFYSMYLRLHLIERGLAGKVLLERDKAVGEVIFLPESRSGGMDLAGYELWEGGKLTTEGRGMNIYVLKKAGSF